MTFLSTWVSTSLRVSLGVYLCVPVHTYVCYGVCEVLKLPFGVTWGPVCAWILIGGSMFRCDPPWGGWGFGVCHPFLWRYLDPCGSVEVPVGLTDSLRVRVPLKTGARSVWGPRTRVSLRVPGYESTDVQGSSVRGR